MLYNKKKPLVENDVVIVYVDEKPAFFARVEKIVPDIKSNWWQLTFLMFQIPLSTFTWILDNEQIRGADFTMNQIPIRLERVVAPNQTESQPFDTDVATQPQSKEASILSMNVNKKD